MNLRYSIIPSSGVYVATITLDNAPNPLSGRELDAIAHRGEPLVAFGGLFSDWRTSFTLAALDLRIPSSFPVQQSWALADFPDAEIRAQVWCDQMLVRIGDAIAALVTADASAPSNQVAAVGVVAGTTVPNSASNAALANWLNL